MKKLSLFAALAVSFMTVLPACASSSGSNSGFDLKDVLGGSSSSSNTTTSAIGGLLDGIFTTSNLEVKDLGGEWTVEGSAVQFQSEDFLKKAGGAAAAGVIEGKLDPYYKKFGLTGAVITIQVDGSFTLKMAKGTLKGTITKKSDGNFNFAVNVLGQPIAGMTAYVSKSPTELNLMFDANKLLNLLTMVAKFTGSSTGTTLSGILGSYDGMCVGFKTKKTGSVEGESNGGLLDTIGNILGGGSSNTKSETKSTETKTETKTESKSSLESILKGRR